MAHADTTMAVDRAAASAGSKKLKWNIKVIEGRASVEKKRSRVRELVASTPPRLRRQGVYTYNVKYNKKTKMQLRAPSPKDSGAECCISNHHQSSFYQTRAARSSAAIEGAHCAVGIDSDAHAVAIVLRADPVAQLDELDELAGAAEDMLGIGEAHSNDCFGDLGGAGCGPERQKLPGGCRHRVQ